MKQETKILYLTLRSVWYDLIDAGLKKEEYRELNSYWAKRLLKTIIHCPSIEQMKEENLKDFTHVHFARGGHFHPTLPQMRFELKEIIIGTGKEEWGAEPGKEYFVIKLGEKLLCT